ncbi:hypothetical protein SE16_10775 [Ardenticatena maritima]|uniref:Helix-hairpin-helix DNA-binding motif class 1 domain-containing protein n=2 Tax=Ardenticatena maritima TaxID=872965 RepID=A0A0P6Y7N3_9CHLR|nr:hypothetical protein SE16_10775 [Ardenticatena maritima]
MRGGCMANRWSLWRAMLVVLLLSTGVNGWLLWWTTRTSGEPLSLIEPTPAPTPTLAPLTVYVSGAVHAPGLYTVPPNSRIADAIAAAGDFSSDAVPEAINLALPLADGMHIHVPAQGEADAPPVVSSGSGAPSGQASAASGLVNINTATVAELDTLPGIGPSIAQRIIDYREQNGAFQTVDELKNVKGIGDKTFAEIAPLVTVGP